MVEKPRTLPFSPSSSSASYDSQSSWMSGAPSAVAASMSLTAGSGSYSTSIAAAASAAISGVRAATAATMSPSNRTFSRANSLRSLAASP